MTLVGTRPELIKMSRVIAELDKYVEHILVHSGQNHDYELNQIFFDELDIRKPDYFLNISKTSVAHSISDLILKVDEIFENIKPDALMLYGDTNTCLAVIVAKRRKIPIFHMEAGNRCFNQCVPEELNRKVIDHLSDINFVLTEHARRYLMAEGVRPETIFKTGSHMGEILSYYDKKIRNSSILQKLQYEKNRYFVVSAHREENVDSSLKLKSLLKSLNSIAETYQYPIYFSTHPRTLRRMQEQDVIKEIHSLIQIGKPLGFIDYIHLQQSAYCVLSDSGTLTEEAAILDLAAVMIREEHERPEGMDTGTVIMSGLNKDNILDAIRVVISQRQAAHYVSPNVEDYELSPVSQQVVRVVLSYIPYVRRTVWHEAQGR